MEEFIKSKINYIIGGCVIIIALLAIIIISATGVFKHTVSCTKITKNINGFEINDEVVMKLSDGKIKNIKVNKEITVGGEYENYSKINEIVERSLNNAYVYLDKEEYEIKSNNNVHKANVYIEKSGIILKNFAIKMTDPDETYSLEFNVQNNIEDDIIAEEYGRYLVGDKYSYNKLKNSIESLGYTCK